MILLEKCVYKITNLINKKCYIGQSKNYKSRIKGHIYQLNKNKHDNPHLQYAWNKYGADNFKFELIDKGENYNELEKHYIQKYNSDNANYGYNILSGGENPPIGSHKSLSKAEVKDIIEMLKDKNISLDFICEKYNKITRGQINKINVGKAWKDKNLEYPLREGDNVIGQEIANKVIFALKYSNKLQKEIAKENNISRTCVTAINLGKVKSYYDINEKYPIR